METVRYVVDALAPDLPIIALLGHAIEKGDLVAFPTETVYGLGADATNADAVDQIFYAKGRPSTDPLIVHLADPSDIPEITGKKWSELPDAVCILAEQFWPGPLTLILPRGELIPPNVSASLATIGVRIPQHPTAQALIKASKRPIAAPSANRFGHTSPTTAQHVVDDLDGRIPWILDGGPCHVGVESTILDLFQYPPLLLRPGGIPVESIEEALGQKIQIRQKYKQDEEIAAPAPGMLLTHYAPRASLIVFAGETNEHVWQKVIHSIEVYANQDKKIGALVPIEYQLPAQSAGAYAVASLGSMVDNAAIARTLFAGLRMLDTQNVSLIISGVVNHGGLGLAVYDRLFRAASGQIFHVE
jgi:L-threonylcarbamoyladenylate synthase